MKYLVYILAFVLTGSLFAGGPARKYAHGVRDDRIVMLISFDESSPRDDSRNGEDGVFDNNASYISAGVVAGGLELDGVNDEVQFSSELTTDYATGAFTVAAWIRNTEASAAVNTIVSDVGSGLNAQFLLTILTTHEVLFRVRDSGLDQADGLSVATFNDSTFHFAVGVRDGTNVTLYMDGVEVASGSNASLDDPDLHIAPLPIIGSLSGQDHANEFEGDIDEVAIFSRALTATEVQQLYQETAP